MPTPAKDVSSVDLQSLVSSYDKVDFLIRVTKQTAHSIEADILEVISWNSDYEPLETELYCRAYMKWDGCCHVWFGEDENGKPNGYLHLCGVDAWKNHIAMMKALYKFAENNIKSFDSSERWNA